MAPPFTASRTRPATWSIASWLMSGPITVSMAIGSPIFRPSTLAASREVKSAAMGASTKIRRVDMQIWPWWRYAPKAVALTA